MEAEDDELERGERPFRPFDTSQDKILPVVGSEVAGRAALKKLTISARAETSYVRMRLRNMFRALENGARLHGVRRGSALSERYLVDTYASIRSGADPSRAFTEEAKTIDTSISAYIVLDESNSMADKLASTSAILYILGDGLDSIGAKFAISGFRAGHEIYGWDHGMTEAEKREAGGKYHRFHAAIHDMFKGFEERYKDVAWKLGNLRAIGGTPMAEGIELGLVALSKRREGHRILFVVTDGQADSNHVPVIKSQLRRASEAGIVVVGVGLGKGSEDVRKTFPDSVFALQLSEIPALLVKKLETLVLKIGTSKRGRAVKETTAGVGKGLR